LRAVRHVAGAAKPHGKPPIDVRELLVACALDDSLVDFLIQPEVLVELAALVMTPHRRVKPRDLGNVLLRGPLASELTGEGFEHAHHLEHVECARARDDVTAAPRFGSSCTRPSDASILIASRSGVRDMPKRSVSRRSFSRSPGSSSPWMMSSRRRSATSLCSGRGLIGSTMLSSFMMFPLSGGPEITLPCRNLSISRLIRMTIMPSLHAGACGWSRQNAVTRRFRRVLHAPAKPESGAGPASAHAARRRRFERILGPVVLRVASPEILAHVAIRTAPEACEIARHLHRPLRRRQQLERDRHAAARDARAFVEPEHFLQPHGHDGRVLVAIVDADVGAARDGEPSGRELVESREARPAEPGAERFGERDAVEMLASADAGEPRREPLV